MINLSGVTVCHDQVMALTVENMDVQGGELVTLLGASGAGKSTLLRLVNGMTAPTTGCASTNGVDLAHDGVAARRRAQRDIGSVTQSLDLPGTLRVMHQVNAGQLGRRSTLASLLSLLKARPESEVLELLERLSLDGTHQRRTDSLSGGQQQRVAIARAVIGRPAVITADEPTSNLDPALTTSVMQLLRSAADDGAAVIAAMHDPAVAKQFSDRLVGLRHGTVVFDRRPEEVSDNDIGDLYPPGLEEQ